jgi:hypothetical protein
MTMVLNVHARDLHATLSQVGALLDGLGSNHDHLWPSDQWPSIHFDRPLSVGAVGGHGGIGYIVEFYEQGRAIVFRGRCGFACCGIFSMDAKYISQSD